MGHSLATPTYLSFLAEAWAVPLEAFLAGASRGEAFLAGASHVPSLEGAFPVVACGL